MEIPYLNEKELRIQYATEFVKRDFNNAIYYCRKFIKNYDKIFKTKEANDFVLEVLGKICEGRGKVYLNEYKNFRGSVYYHITNHLKNHLRINEKEENIISIYDERFNEKEGKAKNFIDTFPCTGKDDIMLKAENYELRDNLFALFDEDKETEDILILDEILKGKKNKEIATDLGLSISAVENAKKRIERRIYNKLDKNLLRGVVKWTEEKQEIIF